MDLMRLRGGFFFLATSENAQAMSVAVIAAVVCEGRGDKKRGKTDISIADR